jgi:integrase/recombinase XerD
VKRSRLKAPEISNAPEGRDPAIGDFLEYLLHERRASPNTVRAYANDLASWEAFCAGAGRKVYPADDAAVSRYMTRLASEGMSSATRMRRAACLAAFTRFLMYDGRIDIAENLPALPKREKKLPQVMTEGEIERLLDSCSEGETAVAIRDRTMIEMAYGCGLRASELVSVTLTDIDEKDGIMYVRGKGRK